MNGMMLLNLAASSAGFALGGVYLKRFGEHGGWGDLGIAFAVFAASNLLYAPLLAKGLGQGAVLSSMAHLIIMSALGVILFGERLNAYNLAGLVTALATVWLFMLASQAA